MTNWKVRTSAPGRYLPGGHVIIPTPLDVLAIGAPGQDERTRSLPRRRTASITLDVLRTS